MVGSEDFDISAAERERERMEEMMKTTKPEEELVQAKMRREITKLDDEELWGEFQPLEIDRIVSGEIKPKTLITHCGLKYTQFRQRGPLIVKEMLSVFPNSTYIKWTWGITNSLKGLVRIAKERECTSLVIAQTNYLGHDEICIVSLLNGAAAYFRIFNLIPRGKIPNQANPPSCLLCPEVHMENFTSPASLGSARLIQSLFPTATHFGTKPCRNNLASFQYQDGFIFYRRNWLHSQTASLAEGGEMLTITRKEAGPRFQLLLTGVKKVALDTGSFKQVCMPPPRCPVGRYRDTISSVPFSNLLL